MPPPDPTITPEPAKVTTSNEPGTTPQPQPQETKTPPAPTTALTAEPPKVEPGKEGTPPEGDKSATPAAFEIKVPEGLDKDDPMLKGFVTLAQEAKLTPEGAQKIADLYFNAQAGAEKAAEEARVEQITKWAEEAKSDKEIGGDNWSSTLTAGRRALNKLGSPELTQMLNETGLGNHKTVIAFFAKVGALLKEDALPGAKESPGTGEEPGLSDVLYPTMK